MQRTGRQLALAFLLLLVAGASWWTWKTFFWSPSLASYDDWIPAHATWTLEAQKDDPRASSAQRLIWSPEQQRRFSGTSLERVSWQWSEGRFLAYGTTLNTTDAVFFFPIRDIDLYEDEMNPAFLSAEHDVFGGFSMFRIGEAWVAPLKDALVVAASKEALQEVILVRQKTSPRLGSTHRLDAVRSELRSSDWIFLFHVDAITALSMIPPDGLDRDRWAGLGLNRKSNQWNVSLYLPTTKTLDAQFAGALLRTVPVTSTMAIGGVSLDRDGKVFSALQLWDSNLNAAISQMPSDLRVKAIEFIYAQSSEVLRVRTPGNDVVTILGSPIDGSTTLPFSLAEDPLLRQLPKDRLLGFIWLNGEEIEERLPPLLARFPFQSILPQHFPFDQVAAVLQSRDRGVTMHIVLTAITASSSGQTVDR